MAGFGTFAIISEYPRTFAAGVALCGGEVYRIRRHGPYYMAQRREGDRVTAVAVCTAEIKGRLLGFVRRLSQTLERAWIRG